MSNTVLKHFMHINPFNFCNSMKKVMMVTLVYITGNQGYQRLIPWPRLCTPYVRWLLSESTFDKAGLGEQHHHLPLQRSNTVLSNLL